MLYSGLVSITFRQLQAKEVIDLVKKAELKGIEWGGDIHVPHGNTKKAREVFKMTMDAGLYVASYGSYYKVGCEAADTVAFEPVLETAVELHAPIIRVWAGNKTSYDADQAWWNGIIDDSVRIASMAQKAGIKISFEYHGNTLTDTSESAVKLLKSVDHLNVYSYWQPTMELNVEKRLTGLMKVSPWLTNIHVFNWESKERMPLAGGTEEWMKYIGFIKKLCGDRFCLIEFVKGDSPEQFLDDAKVLKSFLNHETT